MTFEDAIEIYFKEKDEDGLFKMNDGTACDLFYIVKELEKTYAPKIEMTFEQKDELMKFLGEDEEFEYFWYCYGYGYGREYKEFTESELMRAWLHPELIEVTDD